MRIDALAWIQKTWIEGDVKIGRNIMKVNIFVKKILWKTIWLDHQFQHQSRRVMKDPQQSQECVTLRVTPTQRTG